VLQAEDQPAFAAVLDEAVKGNVLQVVEIFALNNVRSEIRIFARRSGRRSRRQRLRGARTPQ
jgi:hypothetical protein